MRLVPETPRMIRLLREDSTLTLPFSPRVAFSDASRRSVKSASGYDGGKPANTLDLVPFVRDPAEIPLPPSRSVSDRLATFRQPTAAGTLVLCVKPGTMDSI